jgi:hypothetical protein
MKTLLKDLRNIALLLLAFFFLADERSFAASVPVGVYSKQQGAYTQQDLGVLKQGLAFQNTHDSNASPIFTDSYLLTVEPNAGAALAATVVKLSNPNGAYITFTSGSLSNVLTDIIYNLNFVEAKEANSFYLIMDYLAPGRYELLVNGTVNNGTSTYTGNMTVIDTPSSVPIPPAIYLFIGGLSLLSIIQRKQT